MKQLNSTRKKSLRVATILCSSELITTQIYDTVRVDEAEATEGDRWNDGGSAVGGE